MTILHQMDVHVGCSRFGWRYKDLFLEDDTILGWRVDIGVFDRLTTHNFMKLKVFLISVYVDLNLAFCSVVRHAAFNCQDVALF